MKHYIYQSLLIIIAISCQTSDIKASDMPLISMQDYTFMLEHPTTICVYIPNQLRSSIEQLQKKYPHLPMLINTSFFIDAMRTIVPYEDALQNTEKFINFLANCSLKNHDPKDQTLDMLLHYQEDLKSGNACVSLESSETKIGTREVKLVQTDSGEILAAGGILTIVAGSNTNISAITPGSTITFGVSSSPSFSGALSINGNIYASGGISASGPITAGAGLIASTGGLLVNNGGISDVGPTVLKSLTNGIMSTSTTGLASSIPTVTNAVQVGNTGGTISSLPTGTNGQVLLGSTNANPAFAYLGTDGSIVYTTGPGAALSLQSTPLFGNTLRVDQVYGNDSTAAPNGLPYLTIGAALSDASSNDTVWVYPGSYPETLIIPAGVSLRGLDKDTVIISTGVSIATDLVTMNNDSSINNVTLKLSSLASVQLRGIVFPSQTATSAMVDNVNLTLLSAAGNQKIYGIHSFGTGKAALTVPNVHASSVTVNATGTQATRGIILDTNANTFNVSDSTITVNSTGTTSAIGVETAIAGATCNLDHCTISGASSAGIDGDISQTNGNSAIKIAGTKLVNSNPNTFSFSSTLSPALYTWGFRQSTPAVGTSYMIPGAGGATAGSTTESTTQIRAPQAMTIKSLTAHCDAANNLIYVLRVNGVNTALTVTLNSTNAASSGNIAVSCNTGDLISLAQTASGTPVICNVVVTAELY